MSSVGSGGAGGGVGGAGGLGTTLALLVTVCQSAATLSVLSPPGMPLACVGHVMWMWVNVIHYRLIRLPWGCRFKGFVDAFQFSNLAIDLGPLTDGFGSLAEARATAARASIGDNKLATAAVNLAARAGVAARFVAGYTVTIVVIVTLALAAAELGVIAVFYIDRTKGTGRLTGQAGQHGAEATGSSPSVPDKLHTPLLQVTQPYRVKVSTRHRTSRL